MSIFSPDIVFNVPIESEQLVGRNIELKKLLTLLKRLKSPTIQVIGEHGVGKSNLIRQVAHKIFKHYRGINAIYVDCRPTIQGRSQQVKTREGLVRDLAAASGGLSGLDSAGREGALLRRFHNGRWIIFLDSFENTMADDVESFVRQIGLGGTATLVIATTESVSWIDIVFELKPLEYKYVAILIHHGLGGRKIDDSVIDAAVRSCKGLPELAIRAGGLLGSGMNIERVIIHIERDFVSYYKTEMNHVYRSKHLRRIVSFGVAVATPFSLDSAASILNIEYKKASEYLLWLRKHGFLESFNDKYRPRDLLLSAVGTDKLDMSILDDLSAWLNHYTPADDSLSWSLGNINNCNKVEDYVRSFLRLDELTFSSANNKTKLNYAKTGAALAGWMYCQGYWLELDRLTEQINQSLWDSKCVDNLVGLHLVWRLKSLLKRNMFMEALESLKDFSDRLKILPQHNKDYLESALIVFSPQLRHSPGNFNYKDCHISVDNLLITPNANQILEAEIRLESMSKMELVCISKTRRGNIAAEEGDLQTAEQLYSEAGEISSNSNTSWGAEYSALTSGNLGILYNRLGRWHEAIEELEKATPKLAQTSECAVALAELSRSYFAANNRKKALDYWEQALKLANRLGIYDLKCESNVDWTAPSWYEYWILGKR